MPTYHIPLSELQKSLYSRLSSILTAGVLDHAVGQKTLPYASIGEFSMKCVGGRNVAVSEVLGTIHVWSEYEGAKECQEIADTICQSLTGDKLPMTGHTVIDTTLNTFSTGAEWDGATLIRHGVLTIRWLIQ